MPSSFDGLFTLQFWRDRAAQARLMAADISDPAPKALMLEIADKYDVMAKLVEQRRGPKI